MRRLGGQHRELGVPVLQRLPDGLLRKEQQLSASNPALLNAVATGVVRYYPEQEARCMAALLAQGCASDQLLEAIAECTGIFGCPPSADGGTVPTTDSGATCTQFLPEEYQILARLHDRRRLRRADVAPGSGLRGRFLRPTPCGIDIGGCTSLATAGQACASSYLSLVMTADTATSAMCAPGLNCQRPPASAPPCVVAPGNACPGVPLGTCVVPVDVGGACTDDANCKPGLACACGICEIPPQHRAVPERKLPQAGAAYCEPSTPTLASPFALRARAAPTRSSVRARARHLQRHHLRPPGRLTSRRRSASTCVARPPRRVPIELPWGAPRPAAPERAHSSDDDNAHGVMSGSFGPAGRRWWRGTPDSAWASRCSHRTPRRECVLRRPSWRAPSGRSPGWRASPGPA